jgi:energy-coupling factor transporter ATP-binding protein EcfA2
MHIQRIRIANIKSINTLDWAIPEGQAAGWHVIIGDNGAGKSTFLRAVVLALIGPVEAAGLRLDWDAWLRSGTESGSIRLDLRYDPKLDNFSGPGRRGAELVPAAVLIERDGLFAQLKKNSAVKPNPDRHIWSGAGGWFSAAYGPFRRFSGGDTEYERLLSFRSRLAAHLSVFNEAFALGEGLRWLQELQFKRLERQPEGALLDRLIGFVNQDDFLPHHTRISEVTSSGVVFTDSTDQRVLVENLSDGYRSILSMTFELIRQMVNTYGADAVFDATDSTVITAPGVVLIDEVDAHLHPSWQKRIGLWFRRHFPHVQFIVTTHSPLVCQAATEGSVWRLPRPGDSEPGGMVVGQDLDRLLYGNLLDAYSTGVFGLDSTRSEESQRKLVRLAQLNRKELRSQLSAKEQQEQEQLRSILPTTAYQLAE